jgi:hypothetical protein
MKAVMSEPVRLPKEFEEKTCPTSPLTVSLLPTIPVKIGKTIPRKNAGGKTKIEHKNDLPMTKSGKVSGVLAKIPEILRSQ